eukprot:TRINITY_DN26779_c0_g1_i2.p1 TRINITY_DN26779_c0_g1~~TRINITY_DN26779_c0_g1_i2.p1  ORF type:complete len:741 (-),score=114.31 TRINITY_DN26779_c0_g1_i2:135-2357(-)
MAMWAPAPTPSPWAAEGPLAELAFRRISDVKLPDFLTCADNDAWGPLRVTYADAFEHFSSLHPVPSRNTLRESPLLEQIRVSAQQRVDDFIVSTEGGLAVRAGFELLFEWATTPLRDHDRSGERADACLFGAVTCLYIVAWVNSLADDRDQALNHLFIASTLLRLGQLDWTEHSGWPVTSWHVLVNIWRLQRGLEFAPLPRTPTPVDPMASLVPSVWPVPAPRPRRWTKKLSVFYVAMHVVPFSDILAFLKEWWEPGGGAEGRGAAQLSLNYMGFPRCCPGAEGACSPDRLQEGLAMQGDWRIPYCSKDPFMFEVLNIPRLHDHSGGQWANAYASHAPAAWAEARRAFSARYEPWLEEHVDLMLCGHPIYWCTLFEPIVRRNSAKSMIAVYDQPPFFLVPSEAEDSFASTLRDFADPELLPNVAVVGFAPFFARQFEWTFGRRIPHSRPIALVVKDVWQPLRPDAVLVATSIDAYAQSLLYRFQEGNLDLLVDPSGLPLRLIQWGGDEFPYETPKAVLSQLRCVVLTPYDFAHFKLPEFVSMGMPILMYSQLWKWTTRWSQLIARPGGRNASKEHPLPMECYDPASHAFEDGLPMPSMPEAFWRDPWGLEEPESPSACLRALDAWGEREAEAEDGDPGPPYGRSPFSLFVNDRRHLQPLDGTLFWSRWSEMSLIPHSVYFQSIAHLFALLRTLGIPELRSVSEAQRSWHRKAAFQVVDFWRGIVGSLLDGDARAFKGPRS